MNSAIAAPVHPQLQQYLDSFVRVRGREPSAAEIADFERRHRLNQTPRVHGRVE